MKRFFSKSPRVIFLILLLQLAFVSLAPGQNIPPPPPPNGGITNAHGLGGNQSAPDAPLAGGLEVLILLGVLYSIKNVFISANRTALTDKAQ